MEKEILKSFNLRLKMEQSRARIQLKKTPFFATDFEPSGGSIVV
jgi:hypothetical protein